MGRFLDDLNRLSAAAAEGNVLLNAAARPARSASSCDAAAAAHKSAEAARFGRTGLIPRHASCDFVAKHYEVVRELGRGSFSHVKLVRERRTGHERVCKVVSTERMTKEVLELTRMEVQVLATLDHPSIVKLYEYAEDKSQQMLVLILEYIAGGDCSGLLEESGRTLSEGRVARLVHQLLVATSCCHAKGIVHRDIKPQNMMLTRSIGAWGNPSLKVIDFGLAARMQKSRDFVGTPAYMPPEVLDGTVDCTSQADIWSIAATATELLAGEPPFGTPEDHGGDMEPVFDSIRRFRDFGDVAERLDELPSWQGRSAEARDFVRQLLQADPGRRPTALEAMRHPWVRRCAPPPQSGGLTADMVRSMVEYAAAPPLLRCCLLVLSARTGLSEQPRVAAAFVDADADSDGSISREELVNAFAGASICGWSPTEVDAGAVFAAADLGGRGRLGYTEFAAACLYGRYGRSVDRLADQAFGALDEDRDGLLRPGEVRRLFSGEVALEDLAGLPQDRPFGAQEWRACVRAAAERGAGRRGATEAASEEDEGPPSLLRAFLRSLLCEQLMCTNCEQFREAEDDGNCGDVPVVLHHNFDPNTEVPDLYEKPFPFHAA